MTPNLHRDGVIVCFGRGSKHFQKWKSSGLMTHRTPDLYVYWASIVQNERFSPELSGISILDQWQQNTCNSKEKRHPGQRIAERDSSNSKSALPLFSVGDEQGDVVSIFKWMAFIPVIRSGTVDFLVDFFEIKRKKDSTLEGEK